MIFEGREDYIASKWSFTGKLDNFEWTWNDFMKLMDNHPEDMYDRNNSKFRIGLNSFHLRASAPKFAKEIDEEMRDVFSMHSGKITNIAFAGFGLNSGSYPNHKDGMDVLLVQVIGEIEFKLEGKEKCIMEPGDYVWIPRGIYHQITPNKSRVTFSFGVEGEPDPSIYF